MREKLGVKPRDPKNEMNMANQQIDFDYKNKKDFIIGQIEEQNKALQDGLPCDSNSFKTDQESGANF
jgi:hypothetical protein